MLTPTANWVVAFKRADVAPIVLVTIETQHRRFLAIDDYTLMAAQTIVIRANGGPPTLTLNEGIDFSAGTSNIVTATNLATAINQLNLHWLRARTRENVVELLYGQRYYASTSTSTYDAITSSSISTVPAGAAERPSAAPTSYKFVSGSKPFLEGANLYPNAVDKIGTFSATLDPLTRETSVGGMEIYWLDDGALRELATAYNLPGSRVTISIGSHELAESDFFQLSRYWIKDLFPVAGEPRLRMVVDDAMSKIGERRFSGEIINLHPLEALEFILGRVGGIDGTDFVSSTLDPTNYTSGSPEYLRHSHFVVTRADLSIPFAIGNVHLEQTNGIQGELVEDIARELVGLLPGTWTADQNGRYRFLVFDDTAASVRTWQAGAETGHDLEIIDQKTGTESIVNMVSMTYGEIDSMSPQSFTIADRESLSFFNQEFKLDLSTSWCNNFLRAGHNDGTFALADTTLEIDSATGCSGFGGITYNGTTPDDINQTSGHHLANSRRTLLQLVGPTIPATTAGAREIAAFDACTFYRWTAPTGYVAPAVETQYLREIRDPRFGSANAHNYYVPSMHRVALNNGPLFGVATTYNDNGFTSGRAGYGTASAAFHLAFTLISDCTPVAAKCTAILKRFKFGVPRLIVRAPLWNLDLEIGDVVDIAGDERFLNVGRSGLTTGTKWEIVRKELVIHERPPRIEFELAWLRDDYVRGTLSLFDPNFDWIPPLGGGGGYEYIVDNNLTDVFIDADSDGLAETGVIRG